MNSDTDHTESPPGRSSAGTADELELIDAYWRAANYLSVGQIYLMANPLLREGQPNRPRWSRTAGHSGERRPG